MTTPLVPGAVPAHPEPSAVAAEPAGNGEPSLVDDAAVTADSHAEANAAGADPSDAAGQPEGAGAPGSEHDQEERPEHEAADGSAGSAERKRRRRRRKKKPAGQAAGEASSAESSEQGHEPAADPVAGPATAEKLEKRDPKRKEKRHGPPRERAPVNAGDIVFGKILEITEEAILIDIPGKARAIFDRREMLLLDDDEARSAAAPAPADVAAANPSSLASPASPAEASGVEGQPTAEATVPSVDAPAPDAEPLAVAEASAAPTEDAPPAPTKEPSVPRVILEVGADFIAVVHSDGSRGGLVVLTHHPNRQDRARPVIEKAFNEKSVVEGLVTGVIKGGIEVDVDGLRAFAPGSHVDLRLGADLSYLIGQRLPFLVTQYAKRGRDLVLSRRSMVEEEARKARADALSKLKVGEELDGLVRSVVPFGAFVDVGGIEGLVPLQEMSHNRADGPSDVFKVGEATRVKVLKIDDKGKVWLSRKATIADPWQQVALKYAQGTRHSGTVARLQPFGAFIELEPGVDGLIHTQDLTTKRIELPEEVVKVGDALDVIVAHLDTSQHKIALHPAPQGDAANEPPQKVAPHKPVKAKIVTIESGGLVVRILGVTGRNARGYVTAAGTGTPRGTELRKAFHVGQDLEAKVIEMDPRRGEVKLSIKALSEDQERNAYQQYRQQLKAEARFTFGDLLAKKGSSPR
ncbi:MAG: S1 RNA-binding domain-containing protein [Myxococcota bacterium]|nr:S1 RNA-binding domain-containing protein [Myxococcota bacterium]